MRNNRRQHPPSANFLVKSMSFERFPVMLVKNLIILVVVSFNGDEREGGERLFGSVVADKQLDEFACLPFVSIEVSFLNLFSNGCPQGAGEQARFQ